MEQLAPATEYNPYDEMNDLIEQEVLGEMFLGAIERAVNLSSSLPPPLQFRRLLGINERAIYLDNPLRAGVQSNILDTAMTLCDLTNNPDVAWRLHTLQAQALAQDMEVLLPQYYPAAIVPEMRQETVHKLRAHAAAALHSMGSGTPESTEHSSFCRRMLASFPEI
jgi:hypothetical protein